MSDLELFESLARGLVKGVMLAGVIVFVVWVAKLFKRRESHAQGDSDDVDPAIASEGESVEDADEEIYALAMEELNQGVRKAGLWAKAFAESEGNESRAKAIYIRLRVAQEIARTKKEDDIRRRQSQKAMEGGVRESGKKRNGVLRCERCKKELTNWNQSRIPSVCVDCLSFVVTMKEPSALPGQDRINERCDVKCTKEELLGRLELEYERNEISYEQFIRRAKEIDRMSG